MNKSHILKIGCTLAICILPMFAMLYYLATNIGDRTAIYRGETLTWKGIKYVPASGAHKEGKTITKTYGGDWDINEVVGDEKRNFVVIRSFLDQYLLVREDYEIPKSGNVTVVYLDYYEKNVESSFCSVMQEIVNTTTDTESFQFKTDHIFSRATEIHFGYEKCPVGTHYVGFIGFIENKWVYIKHFEEGRGYNEDGSLRKDKANCKIIDEKYVPDIEKYFKKR